MKKRGLLYLSILFSGVLALASCNDIASSSKTNSKTALPSATSTPTNTTKTTTKSTKTTVDLMEFSVTVKYQDGYKCSGAKVKFYDMNGNQVTEEISTSNAKATIKLPEDKKYYAVVTNLESGYSFNPFKSILSKDNPNGEIVLVDLSIAKDGDGTNNSPYSISTGYYATKGNNDYYSVKFDTSGTYVLESFTNGSSSKLKFYGNSLSNNPEEVTSGGEISNFKYLFTVSEKDVASDSLFYFSIEAEANSLLDRKSVV